MDVYVKGKGLDVRTWWGPANWCHVCDVTEVAGMLRVFKGYLLGDDETTFDQSENEMLCQH